MATDVVTDSPTIHAPRLAPAFQVELRRRYAEHAPLERVVVHARTIASARHAVKLAHPDAVIVSIARSD